MKIQQQVKNIVKRGEIAPKEQFLLFPQYFQYIFNFKSPVTHIYLLNVVNRISFSSVLQIWYVEVRISRNFVESPLEFEITRVDCMSKDPTVLELWHIL